MMMMMMMMLLMNKIEFHNYKIYKIHNESVECPSVHGIIEACTIARAIIPIRKRKGERNTLSLLVVLLAV